MMPNSYNSTPPSFAPRSPRRRPSIQGAKPVGRDDATQPYSVASGRSHVTSGDPHAPEQALHTYPPEQAVPTYPPKAYPPRTSPTAQPPQFAPARVRAPQTGAASPYSRPAPGVSATPPYSQQQFGGAPVRAPRSGVLRKIRRGILIALALWLAITLVWVGYLYSYGNARLNHVDALSGAPNTPGTTYLIVGSDQRSAGSADPTEGMRSDTIMLLHKPARGAPSLISIPRDAWVDIPGNGEAKINAAFAWGGQKLLVQTVEQLTGLTIDHYVQIGMAGVEDLTDAVGGIHLCLTDKNLSFPLSDPESNLVWEKSGCKDVDGKTALAFSRMRKADPQGDIGRTKRQRQVVGAILRKALSPSLVMNPFRQKDLVGSTASVLTVDSKDSIADIGTAGLALRTTMGADGLLGTPPISSLDYWVDGQSAVQLDPDRIDEFWKKMREGTLTAADFKQPGQ